VRSDHVDFEVIRLASLLESDPAAATRQAAQLLSVHPDHPAALLLLGSAHRRLGDAAAAVADFTTLAASQPGSAVVRLELGRALHAAGRDAEALVALGEAVRLAPDLAPAWRELSLLHAARHDPAACDAAWMRFEKLTPEAAAHTEAAAALANERLDAAAALLQRSLEHSPQDVVALRLLAQVAAAREDYAQAERLLGECLRLAPGYGGARLALVDILHQQLRGEPMLPLLERLLTAEPDHQLYRTLQAVAYDLLGRSGRAIEILEQLVQEFPDSEVVWLNYGHALRATGRQREAVDAYRKCIELRSGTGSAWVALADLKTYRFTGDDVAAMQLQLARDGLRSEERSRLELALGKALEDSGDFAAAFEHYARGNALRRAVVHYDSANITRFVQLTRTLCTPEFFTARARWGCPSPDPIFIVGLPRAGSTLLEQILASHSQVEGTRELTDVIRFALDLGDREEPGKAPTYPQSLARLTRAEAAALGERYLAQTHAYRLLGRPRFIDKMGPNFLHVGLIHLMLPNARIIDARRAPLGCCFANFKQHFQSGAWFTYSLEDLGRYYRDYVTLMAHFDTVLPGRIHRVSYEELVRDLEGEVRRLLDYCGLPFEEQCLRFHETHRSIATVSSEQVRQPIYTASIEQWRNFAPWLGPLKEALGDLAETGVTRAS
jgi:tetratricopeptide (TPR) repeat protein